VGEPPGTDSDHRDAGHRPVYRGLYFNLARDDDVELLGWLLAVPRSRRTRAIKAVLQTGLPAYVAARHPGALPVPPEAVRAGLGPHRRPRSGLHKASPASAIPASTGSTEGPSGASGPEPDPVAERSSELVDPRATAEARLDRLLQSFR
jgi:hypothetical protein